MKEMKKGSFSISGVFMDKNGHELVRFVNPDFMILYLCLVVWSFPLGDYTSDIWSL
jgi:hypothetical protein